ncbi:MAG: hypothetical protein AAF203_11390 [Pseudomonadota bacterium]
MKIFSCLFTILFFSMHGNAGYFSAVCSIENITFKVTELDRLKYVDVKEVAAKSLIDWSYQELLGALDDRPRELKAEVLFHGQTVPFKNVKINLHQFRSVTETSLFLTLFYPETVPGPERFYTLSRIDTETGKWEFGLIQDEDDDLVRFFEKAGDCQVKRLEVED